MSSRVAVAVAGVAPERLSIEVTNRCFKGCELCYAGSHPEGDTLWTLVDLVRFVRSCAEAGTAAVSFGGGEPLELEGVFDLLTELHGVVFRSLTTHGLLLGRHFSALVRARPDKVHVSIHRPEREAEVQRVIRQVHQLRDAGIESGVNLLVRRSALAAAARTARALWAAGVEASRIVYLPLRGRDTPSAREVAEVAGRRPFQSMSCLTACARSERFASVGWDQTVAWCSYTRSRSKLPSLDAIGLAQALSGLELVFCGTDELVLPRSLLRQHQQ